MAGLMKKMSVRPVRPKPSLSKPAKRASTTCSRAWTEKRAHRADNVIVERCFRSLKSEHGTPSELRRLVAGYVEQYNGARPHHNLSSTWCTVVSPFIRVGRFSGTRAELKLNSTTTYRSGAS